MGLLEYSSKDVETPSKPPPRDFAPYFLSSSGHASKTVFFEFEPMGIPRNQQVPRNFPGGNRSELGTASPRLPTESGQKWPDSQFSKLISRCR